jgi:hypothetical protein
VLVDKPQTFALTWCEQFNAILIDIGERRHNVHSKRRLGSRVYFNARRGPTFKAAADTKTPQNGPSTLA